MQIKTNDYICQESALTNGSKMVVRQRIQALLKERGVKKNIKWIKTVYQGTEGCFQITYLQNETIQAEEEVDLNLLFPG